MEFGIFVSNWISKEINNLRTRHLTNRASLEHREELQFQLQQAFLRALAATAQPSQPSQPLLVPRLLASLGEPGRRLQPPSQAHAMAKHLCRHTFRHLHLSAVGLKWFPACREVLLQKTDLQLHQGRAPQSDTPLLGDAVAISGVRNFESADPWVVQAHVTSDTCCKACLHPPTQYDLMRARCSEHTRALGLSPSHPRLARPYKQRTCWTCWPNLLRHSLPCLVWCWKSQALSGDPAETNLLGIDSGQFCLWNCKALPHLHGSKLSGLLQSSLSHCPAHRPPCSLSALHALPEAVYSYFLHFLPQGLCHRGERHAQRQLALSAVADVLDFQSADPWVAWDRVTSVTSLAKPPQDDQMHSHPDICEGPLVDFPACPVSSCKSQGGYPLERERIPEHLQTSSLSNCLPHHPPCHQSALHVQQKSHFLSHNVCICNFSSYQIAIPGYRDARKVSSQRSGALSASTFQLTTGSTRTLILCCHPSILALIHQIRQNQLQQALSVFQDLDPTSPNAKHVPRWSSKVRSEDFESLTCWPGWPGWPGWPVLDGFLSFCESRVQEYQLWNRTILAECEREAYPCARLQDISHAVASQVHPPEYPCLQTDWWPQSPVRYTEDMVPAQFDLSKCLEGHIGQDRGDVLSQCAALGRPLRPEVVEHPLDVVYHSTYHEWAHRQKHPATQTGDTAIPVTVFVIQSTALKAHEVIAVSSEPRQQLCCQQGNKPWSEPSCQWFLSSV